MPRIVLKDFNLGGTADSILQGPPNSLYSIVGAALHDKPGLLLNSQKLKKESGSTVTTFVRYQVVCSNGEVYFFSSTTGEVWRRKTDGTYEAAYTTVPAAGNAGCLGAIEFNGYIVWATQSRLHRITTANALTTTWSVLDLNWQTFTNANSSYHPMVEANLNLYIGDGNLVALVDDAFAFTANKLDINTPHVVSSMGRTSDGYQLLIGTTIASTVNRCKIYRWNTWSSSFSADDDIFENGVNCFLPFDNLPVAQIGNKGNIYYLSGDSWVRYKRIPGDWSIGKSAIVYDNAAVNNNGTVLFGLSNDANNPTSFGIYELGSYGPDYPIVINLKHIISTTNVSSLLIGSVKLLGDKLLVTWQDNTPGTKGVDIVDTLNRTNIGYVETRLVNDQRDVAKRFRVRVAFNSRPSGTGITMYAAKNGGAYSSLTFAYDDDRMVADLIDEFVFDAASVRFKFELVAPADNTNRTAEIEQIIIDY